MARIDADTIDIIRPYVVAADTDERREDYRNGRFPRADRTKAKDLDMRYRWDLFWSIPSHVRYAFTDAAGDVTDAHIDTVLRKIVRGLA